MRTILLLLCTMLLSSLVVNAQTVSPSNSTGYFESNPSFTVTGGSGSIAYDLYYDPAFMSPPIFSSSTSNGTITVPSSVNSGVIFCKISGAPPTSLLYNPGNIQPKVQRPGDFEMFWDMEVANSKKYLNGSPIPLNLTLTPMSTTGTTSDVYKFELPFRNGSNDNVSLKGIISIPKTGSNLPAVLKLPAFTADPINDYVASKTFQEPNIVYIKLSLHDQPQNYQGQSNNGKHRSVTPTQNNNKDDFYYKHVLLGALKLIDYINENGADIKVDPNKIYTGGESQGGLGLMIAGLDHMSGTSSVKAAAASKPGFGEMQLTEATGTPIKATAFPRRWNWSATNTASLYYNMPYFLEEFDRPVMCDLGFTDDVCPAATVYSSLNSLQDNVVIVNKMEGHQTHNEFYDYYLRFYSKYSPIPDLSNFYHAAAAGQDISAQVNSAVSFQGSVVSPSGGSADIGESRFQNKRWEIVKCLSGNCSGQTPNTVIGSNATTSHTFTQTGQYLVRFSINDIDRLNSENLFLTLRDHLVVNVTGSGGCNLTASPSTVSFPAGGGTQTVTISEAGFSLSPTSPFTSSISGSTVTFTASANNTGSPRNTTVTVSKAGCSSTTISISQPSTSSGSCAIDFTSFTEASSTICSDARTYSLAFNSASSHSNVVVYLNNVPTNQFHSATSSDPSTPVITYENGFRQLKWTIASVAANTNYSAQFNFCYAGGNPPHMTATTSTNSSNSCDITSGGGSPPACNLSATPSTVTFPAAGGTQNVTINEAGFSLSPASPFTASISGTTVTFTASANNTGSPRTATITVTKSGCTSTTISISQPSSSTGNCAIDFTSFTEASSSICSDARTYSLAFNSASSHSNVVIYLNNVPTNQFHSATSSDPSTPVITYENGFRQIKWTIASVAANTNYSAQFNFCYAGSNPPHMTATTSTNSSNSCDLPSGGGNPPACNLSATPSTVTFPAAGGTQNVTINETGFSLSPASPFTAAISGATVTFTASANNTGSTRTATITVTKSGCTSTTISISQPSGTPPACAINFTSFTEASSSICTDANTYTLDFNAANSHSNVVIFLDNVPVNQFHSATSNDPSTPIITYENGYRQLKWTIANVAANFNYSASFNFCYAGSNPLQMTASTSTNNSSSCDITSSNNTRMATAPTAGNSSIKVFPNPSRGTSVSLEINALQNEDANILLYDGLGRIVKEMTISLEKGQTILPLVTEDLPTGIYRIRLVSSTEDQVTSLVIFE